MSNGNTFNLILCGQRKFAQIQYVLSQKVCLNIFKRIKIKKLKLKIKQSMLTDYGEVKTKVNDNK